MRRLPWALLSLALIAGILVAGRLVPTPNERVAQLSTSGKVGESVDTGGFKVTVHKVRTARTLIQTESFGAQGAQRTDGIWLVIDATIVGDWRPTSYDDSELETSGGFLYRGSDRFSSGVVTEDTIQPGIARRGAIVFELPKDRLEGARLRLGRSQTEDVRLGPEAVIDLDIDAAKAAKLVKDASKQLRVPKVVYG